LVRQVLGAIAQFDKATVVAKLKAARDRKREEEGKCGGRKSYAERAPKWSRSRVSYPTLIKSVGQCHCERLRLASPIAAS
jgi:hypothetical protein